MEDERGPEALQCPPGPAGLASGTADPGRGAGREPDLGLATAENWIQTPVPGYGPARASAGSRSSLNR